MGIGAVLRRMVVVGAFVGLAFPVAAAECPAPADGAPGPERPMALRQILELPNQPDPALESSQVTTVGYLVNVRRLSAKTAPCPGGPWYRLWLSAHEPVGLRGIATRHRAVVATLPASLFPDRAGGVRALERLVHKRIWLTGRMTFNAAAREEMMRTRGSLWEFRVVTGFGACPSKSCSLTQHPPAESPPAARSDKARR